VQARRGTLAALESGEAMEHQTGPGGPAKTEEPEQAGPEVARVPEVGRAREPQPVPTTGEPRVDAALKLLDRLPDLPVSEHSQVFEEVHAQLSDVLGELDSGPAGPAGG
jgi:hypothetical protein